MIESLKREIEFLDKCSKIELINKGLSYAKVFKLYQDDKKYILKVYKDNNVDRKGVTDKYIETNQPIPKVLEYGKTESLGYYIIMDYMGNGTLEEVYNTLLEEDIFNKARTLGNKQKILIENYTNINDNFFSEFKQTELKKYNQTVDLIEKYKEVLPDIDTVKIKNDIERLIEYFKDDEPLYMHWDLKADNVMVSDEFLMIDYENSALIYLPIALRCEIYHIMNNDEKANKSKQFIKGIISGIDKKQLEDKNLNKKLAYAYLKSSFVYIVGYLLTNNRIEEAKEQIDKINKVYTKSEKLEKLLQ
ncbi:MAG: hypothetical protein HFJ59_07810 [Clostridia bacterium]|nr:hypothetical protein [Clostridia bacterium]